MKEDEVTCTKSRFQQLRYLNIYSDVWHILFESILPVACWLCPMKETFWLVAKWKPLNADLYIILSLQSVYFDILGIPLNCQVDFWDINRGNLFLLSSVVLSFKLFVIHATWPVTKNSRPFILGTYISAFRIYPYFCVFIIF